MNCIRSCLAVSEINISIQKEGNASLPAHRESGIDSQTPARELQSLQAGSSSPPSPQFQL